MTDVVTCSVCGKAHPLEASEFVLRLPDIIHSLSEEGRASRCDISADVCVLDRERFFVRGLLPLPVSGRMQPYNLGVWAEISSDSFRRIYERWSDPDQANEPRLPGTLANSLPLQEEDTLGLQLSIQLTGPKTRPKFYVQVPNHSLYSEQMQGIDQHRAIECSDRKRHSTAV